MDAAPLHDALRPFEFLLGTWRGRGSGKYPGIDDFEYAEEARFWHYGRPVLAYSQRTWSPASGAPMHSEMGFWRPAGGGVEVVLSHAFGITEVLTGHVEGGRLSLRSEDLTSAPAAKVVEAVAREYEVSGDTLRYDVAMAFGEHELQPHLTATLERAAE
ncbi:MAG TPA: FABP family protein [Actinomycetota bacterium]|nr:FABP family protein [Actinomycetota bacterium]